MGIVTVDLSIKEMDKFMERSQPERNRIRQKMKELCLYEISDKGGD